MINGVAVPESCDAWCALAQPANLAGLPAASVPIGPGRSGLPVGLQIIGARWADATMLRAAAAVTACRLARRPAKSRPPAGRHPHPRQNWPIGIQRVLTMAPGRGAHSRRSARNRTKNRVTLGDQRPIGVNARVTADLIGRERDSDRDGDCPDLADLCATQVWRLVRGPRYCEQLAGPAENLASFTVGLLAPSRSDLVKPGKPGGCFCDGYAWFPVKHRGDRRLVTRRGPAYSELARAGASPVPVMAGRVARKALTGNWLVPSMASSVRIRPSSPANLPACPAPAQTSTRAEPGR